MPATQRNTVCFSGPNRNRRTLTVLTEANKSGEKLVPAVTAILADQCECDPGRIEVHAIVPQVEGGTAFPTPKPEPKPENKSDDSGKK